MGMPLNRQGGRVRAPWGEGARKSKIHPGAIPGNLFRNDFLAVRRSWRGNGVACFWATSLEKIFGGVIAISYPFGRKHGRHRAMRRLRLNRAPSFQCRDVYQDCTPTHLHWFRTGMTDVPFAAVSGDALAAYSRCSTMSAVGNLKTPRQSALSSRRLFCCFEGCRISPRPTGKQTS